MMSAFGLPPTLISTHWMRPPISQLAKRNISILKSYLTMWSEDESLSLSGFAYVLQLQKVILKLRANEVSFAVKKF